MIVFSVLLLSRVVAVHEITMISALIECWLLFGLEPLVRSVGNLLGDPRKSSRANLSDFLFWIIEKYRYVSWFWIRAQVRINNDLLKIIRYLWFVPLAPDFSRSADTKLTILNRRHKSNNYNLLNFEICELSLPVPPISCLRFHFLEFESYFWVILLSGFDAFQSIRVMRTVAFIKLEKQLSWW